MHLKWAVVVPGVYLGTGGVGWGGCQRCCRSCTIPSISLMFQCAATEQTTLAAPRNSRWLVRKGECGASLEWFWLKSNGNRAPASHHRAGASSSTKPSFSLSTNTTAEAFWTHATLEFIFRDWKRQKTANICSSRPWSGTLPPPSTGHYSDVAQRQCMGIY